MAAGKQKAIELLSALSTLPSTTTEPSTDPPPDLAILHKDLISLLSLLYASSTKLALALNPSSPAYDASITPLNDIIKHKYALCHCLSFYSLGTYGDALGKEVQIGVTDVLDTVRDLGKTLLRSVREGFKGDARLVSVGTVHDVIERVKGSLSKDNLEAVQKRWEADAGILEDSLREVQEMLEDDDEDEDDGWDELGLGGSAKLSEEEKERVKKVHQILRLTTSVHKRVLTDILKSPGPSNIALDAAVLQSSAFVSSVDDLVATLYVPQDNERVKEEIKTLKESVQSLEKAVNEEKSKDWFGMLYRAIEKSHVAD